MLGCPSPVHDGQAAALSNDCAAWNHIVQGQGGQAARGGGKRGVHGANGVPRCAGAVAKSGAHQGLNLQNGSHILKYRRM
jgi:hypothetical protein